MRIPYKVVYTDGGKSDGDVENPPGALPESLTTSLDAITVAESTGKRVGQISLNGGMLVTREAIMEQAKLYYPRRAN